MKEEVVELVRKEQDDAQWNALHDAERDIARPSERQKAIVSALAHDVGLEIDVGKLRSSEQASRLIDRLRILARRMNGAERTHNPRAAFGMVVKLFFHRYVQLQRDPTKQPEFWQEVRRFYETYEREQELAMSGGAEELATDH